MIPERLPAEMHSFAGGRSDFWALALVVSALAWPQGAGAQTSAADSLRAELRLSVPPSPQSTQPAFRPVPAMAANSPTGWGAQWGDFFVGAAYQARARNVDAHDGAVGAGFGLGNAQSLVGLEVAVVSFSTFRSGWGKRMGVDLKLHRNLPGQIGLAIGWEGALIRGKTDSLRSGYGALSRWFVLRPDPRSSFSALVLSVGLGNGRFQDPEDWAAGDRGIGVFGSAALRVLEPVSIIADWTGQDLMLAGSVAPLRSHSVIMSLGMADLSDSAGDGARMILSAGYAYRIPSEP